MDIMLSPIHLGEVLLEDFVKPLGLTQYRVGQANFGCIGENSLTMLLPVTGIAK